MSTTKAFFNIGNLEYYEGYYDKRQRWNGWARPYFEKSIAELIAHNFSSSDYQIVYDKYTDCFICKIYENDSVTETEIIEKKIISTSEGKKELYDFGSIGWTWDDYELKDLKNMKDIHIITKDKIENKDYDLNIEY